MTGEQRRRERRSMRVPLDDACKNSSQSPATGTALVAVAKPGSNRPTVGFVWGWVSLTAVKPLSPPALIDVKTRWYELSEWCSVLNGGAGPIGVSPDDLLLAETSRAWPLEQHLVLIINTCNVCTGYGRRKPGSCCSPDIVMRTSEKKAACVAGNRLLDLASRQCAGS